MKSLLAVTAVLLIGCVAQPRETQTASIELPVIPAAVTPDNGSVVEYWPNGKTRSERVYRSGRVQEAIYYASDGTVVFEMSEDGPEVASAGR